MRIATRSVAGPLLLASLALSACTTTEKGPESSSLPAVRMASSPELAGAVEDFREARYQQAFDRAKTLSRSSQPPLREQAAWVAGLAAYQMSMLDEAELQFMAAARSQDRRLVTDTKIMMGDIRVLQNRWSDAAQQYREAAGDLSGDERSRVLGYAEVATARAGERGGIGTIAQNSSSGSSASGSGSAARSSSSTPAVPVRSGAPSAGASGAFALQAGAFQSEGNARRRATEISSQLRSAGLGEPRIVRMRDSGGREFWSVQVGSFPSRQSAETAKAKVPSLDLFIAAAG